MVRHNEATLRIKMDPEELQRSLTEAFRPMRELIETLRSAVEKWEVTIPTPEQEDTDSISDGYHTFGELYDHRRALTAALAKAAPHPVDGGWEAWRSKRHHPDELPIFEGYFVVGIDLPNGTITYHYELAHWDDFAHVQELRHARKWDGASPADTVNRLLTWARM